MRFIPANSAITSLPQVSPSDVIVNHILPALVQTPPEGLNDLLTELFCYAWGVIAPSVPLALPQTAQVTFKRRNEPDEQYLHLIAELADPGFGAEIKNRDRFEHYLEGIRKTLEWCFIHDKQTAVWIVESIGAFLGDTGRLNEQIRYCNQALEIAIAEEMVVSQIGLYSRLGWICILKGRLAQAGSYLIKALKIIQIQQDKRDAGKSSLPKDQLFEIDKRYVQILRDLGHLRAKQKHYTESLYLISQSEHFATKLDDELPKIQAPLFRAWTYCFKAENERDMESYKEAETILFNLQDRVQNHPRQLALACRLQAEVAIAKQQFDKARDYLNQATQVAFTRYFKAQEQVTLAFTWGKYFTALGDNLVAIEQYRVSAQLANVLGMLWDQNRVEREIEKLKIKSSTRGKFVINKFLLYNITSVMFTDALTRIIRRMSHPEYPFPSPKENMTPVQVFDVGVGFLKQLALLPQNEQRDILDKLTKIAYDEGIVLSPDNQLTESTQLDPIPSVNPEVAQQAFQTIIESQLAGYEGKPRRRPYLIQNVWKAFRENNYEAVELDVIADQFNQVTDVKKKRSQAQTAISRANGLFQKLGCEIEIHRYKKTYRIQPR